MVEKHPMVGKTIKEDEDSYEIVDTRHGTYGLIYILKDSDGDLWEIQDHDVADVGDGFGVCGEMWPA